MQQRDPSVLAQMTGIQYEFAPSHFESHGLFVIRRVERFSPTDAEVLAQFYCLGSPPAIHVCPKGTALVESCVARCTWTAHAALRELAETVSFSPALGYEWTSSDGCAEPSARDDRPAEPGVESRTRAVLDEMISRRRAADAKSA